MYLTTVFRLNWCLLFIDKQAKLTWQNNAIKGGEKYLEKILES